jgi:xylulose-5-phosphate/fructose-6-phosphate phosphoketolase
MEWALSEIRAIQKAARSGNPIVKPRWPMLVLRTPKGWSGPKSLHGEYVEGSFKAHQVPLPAAKTDQEELEMLQEWLESYKPKELFTESGSPVDAVLSICPEGEKRLGMRPEAYKAYQPLHTPEWKKLTIARGGQESCMKAVGGFLREVIEMWGSFLRSFFIWQLKLLFAGTQRHSVSFPPTSWFRINCTPC